MNPTAFAAILNMLIQDLTALLTFLGLVATAIIAFVNRSDIKTLTSRSNDHAGTLKSVFDRIDQIQGQNVTLAAQIPAVGQAVPVVPVIAAPIEAAAPAPPDPPAITNTQQMVSVPTTVSVAGDGSLVYGGHVAVPMPQPGDAPVVVSLTAPTPELPKIVDSSPAQPGGDASAGIVPVKDGG